MLGAKINSATGGTISSIAGYVVHTFTSSGTFTPNGSGPIEVLVVGSGGNGSSIGGAGGGGSVLYRKFIPVVSGVGYTMSIGAAQSPAANGTPGNPTTFNYNGGTIIAPRGGGGGDANPLGSSGGSNPNGTAGAAANVIGFGFAGGNGDPAAGGGGGAGGPGSPGLGSGFGGLALGYSISGITSFYGGGAPSLAPVNYFPVAAAGVFGCGGRWPHVPAAAQPGIVIIRYPS
jgi:hypothetical protein